MGTKTLFITAENLKQPLNWEELEEQINEFRYIHTVEHRKIFKEEQTTDTSNQVTTRIHLKKNDIGPGSVEASGSVD